MELLSLRKVANRLYKLASAFDITKTVVALETVKTKGYKGMSVGRTQAVANVAKDSQLVNFRIFI